MPSNQQEVEVSDVFNPDEVDIADVVNSFTTQIAEQAMKLAASEARCKKLATELGRVNAENAALHKIVRETPQHNGRTTKPKSKAKKGK